MCGCGSPHYVNCQRKTGGKNDRREGKANSCQNVRQGAPPDYIADTIGMPAETIRSWIENAGMSGILA